MLIPYVVKGKEFHMDIALKTAIYCLMAKAWIKC